MHKFVRFVLILAMALVFAGESHAWQNGFKTDKVEAEIITESPSVNPEQPFDILVKFEMKNGWHILPRSPETLAVRPKLPLNFRKDML